MSVCEVHGPYSTFCRSCDMDWGGTWGYTTKDHPNSSVNGYRTKNSALKGWLTNAFGKHTSKAVLSLLDKQVKFNYTCSPVKEVT